MFQIDRYGRQPIYEQIIEQVEQLVASGVLRPDDQLPSVRTLSQTLSANPNTLQKAYAELERRGVTTGVPGSGRYISKDAPRIVTQSMGTLLSDITAISTKLFLAGIPVEKVLNAVTAAYAAYAPASEGNQIQEANPSPRQKTDDAPQGESGKDAKQ
ncbi:MAG: GntR family transcriptional regulator [Eubacteriales bacterium]|nr:GntR family transcriptional regulator [Eubacteriales bacterium]